LIVRHRTISFWAPPVQYPRAGSTVTQPPSTASLRSLYLEWVEEQLEEFKDSVPRSELLTIADEVVTELQMNRKGQYQLTELLLLEEVDRTLFKRLKLPSFRTWAAAYRQGLRQQNGTRDLPPVTDPEPAGPVTALPSIPAAESAPHAVHEARAASF
jgi:hypothetical protein